MGWTTGARAQQQQQPQQQRQHVDSSLHLLPLCHFLSIVIVSSGEVLKQANTSRVKNHKVNSTRSATNHGVKSNRLLFTNIFSYSSSPSSSSSQSVADVFVHVRVCMCKSVGSVVCFDYASIQYYHMNKKMPLFVSLLLFANAANGVNGWQTNSAIHVCAHNARNKCGCVFAPWHTSSEWVNH